MEQDADDLIIFTVDVIIMDEFQELPHLLFGDGLSCYTVVDNYRSQFKTKRVLVQNIVIHRHLEGRPQHTSDRMNRTISSAVTLLLYQEQLCIGYLYLGYHHMIR